MALIILAHPDYGRSFANRTIVEELQQSGREIAVRNIHTLYPDYRIDVQAEQEALLAHSTVVFQYPFYWYNMPAILKHWFDVVFEYGFAYGSSGDKLKGKNFVPSFTVGAPESGYRTMEEHHFRVPEFCRNIEQTAYYAQMNYVDPVYFYGTSLAAGYAEEDIRIRAKEHAKRLLGILEGLDGM